MAQNIEEILAGLSQEIRTPVNTIASFARLLCNTDDPAKKRRYVDIIQTNCSLLQNLLDDMLDSAKDTNTPAPVRDAEHSEANAGTAKSDMQDDEIPITSEHPKHRGVKPTLLVAEDNESNYFLMSSLLEDDYNLIHAWNGREAVELFSEKNPDLILMDINMPLMDGYEATRNIRQLSGSVPVIAVTAYAFSSDRTRIMESGFDSYVSKPVNADRLLSEISRLLG